MFKNLLVPLDADSSIPTLPWSGKWLAAWQDTMAEHLQRSQELFGLVDVPYFYNERASIGFLAHAVHGFPESMALEEFSQEKENAKAGRGDLWFGFLDSGKTWNVYLEAKQGWPRLLVKRGDRSDIDKSLNDVLQNAIDVKAEDLPSAALQSSLIKLAAVFYVPVVASSEWREFDMQRRLQVLNGFLADLRNRVDPILGSRGIYRAIVPWFPELPSELLKHSEFEGKKQLRLLCPGVVLVIGLLP